jgi:PhnB protein
MNAHNPIVPYLMVRGAKRAVEFYERAFDAKELQRYEDPDGERLGHVTLRVNGALLYVSDEFPELAMVHTRAPDTLGGTTTTVVLHVDDPDWWFTRAVNAGAEPIRPLADSAIGRNGQVRDPFGHIWFIIGNEGS